MSDNKETTSKIKKNEKIIFHHKKILGRMVFEELKVLMFPITKIII